MNRYIIERLCYLGNGRKEWRNCIKVNGRYWFECENNYDALEVAKSNIGIGTFRVMVKHDGKWKLVDGYRN